jgi:hypothetical protein
MEIPLSFNGKEFVDSNGRTYDPAFPASALELALHLIQVCEPPLYANSLAAATLDGSLDPFLYQYLAYYLSLVETQWRGFADWASRLERLRKNIQES